MSLPDQQDAAFRHLTRPLARVGDAGLAVGALALITSWAGLAPASWLWPALLLVLSGYTITTIARSELRAIAADEAVTSLGRSTDAELMHFRAELMQPARDLLARFWSGVGATPAPRCRWRVAHVACAGYIEAAPGASRRGDRLCSCNCHRTDALGLTGPDHASLWRAAPDRFQRARRRSLPDA